MGLFSWRKKSSDSKATEEGDMSFLDHLEELRWTIFRALFPVILAGVALFTYRQVVLKEIFFKPFEGDFYTYKILCRLSEVFCFDTIPITMQALSPQEQFLKAMVFSLFGGVIISFPWITWQVWRFIKPGLKNLEIKVVRWNVFFSSFLFIVGILFGYFVLLPFSLRFFSMFSIAEGVANNWRIGDVISFIMMILLGTGLLFQMPVIVYYLSKLGILSPALMRNYRKHSIIGVLILAAFLTPPDPLSQIIIAIPLTLLYEIGVLISARVERNRLKALK